MGEAGLMRRMAAVVALLALGSCATPPAGPAPAPAPAPAPVAEAPRPPPPRPDQCGAYQLQHLVGRSRSEIPIPLYPERQRVACTTCPVTEDLRPDRLNFFFEAGTGLIREIRCG